MTTKSLNKVRAERRWVRIAEIAREIYHQDAPDMHCEGDCITPAIAKAVDDARRAEYYERQEAQS